MNKYDVALERIKAAVKPDDSWNDSDYEHIKTVVEALELASRMEENNDGNN